MKKTVSGLSLIFALLFSATIGAALVYLATANPIAYLPVIAIKSDGTVEPETPFIKQDGDVYTLTGDLVRKYAIVIQCSNIVFNGATHLIDGSFETGYGYSNRGLSVESATNVTVKDVEVKGFIDADISIENTSNSVFLRLKAELFYLRNSSFNTLTGNNIISDDSLRFPQLIMLSSNNNTVIGNNIVSLYLDFGYNNTFFKNNFVIGYFSVNGGNFWDNGLVGNYWSGYNGADANGDGIGDTSYVIGSDAQDRFPLMNPWDPEKPYDTVPPRITVVSPENRVYNVSSVPLTFLVYEASSWVGYSLDGQDNVSIVGNATLSGLQNGSHNVTVYVTDVAGNTGASETVSFIVDAPFPATLIVAPVASVAVAGAALALYFKKRNGNKH